MIFLYFFSESISVNKYFNDSKIILNWLLYKYPFYINKFSISVLICNEMLGIHKIQFYKHLIVYLLECLSQPVSYLN